MRLTTTLRISSEYPLSHTGTTEQSTVWRFFATTCISSVTVETNSCRATVSLFLSVEPLSRRESVRRSSIKRCILSACSRMSSKCCGCSSALPETPLTAISRKPLRTVRGVLNSCETFATKSRRMASSFSCSVTSRAIKRAFLRSATTTRIS